jgi:hypothetical protein
LWGPGGQIGQAGRLSHERSGKATQAVMGEERSDPSGARRQTKPNRRVAWAGMLQGVKVQEDSLEGQRPCLVLGGGGVRLWRRTFRGNRGLAGWRGGARTISEVD